MYSLVLIVHIVVCIFLIIVVLLQSGKAADLAGAFGGMGSQTAFGPRGSATLLSKATTVSAILFMLTSLSLSIIASRQSGLGTSVLDTTTQKSAPAVPVQTQAPVPAQTAPAGVPTGGAVPVQVQPQQGNNPNQINIDMGKIAQPPADKKAPAAPKKK